MSDLTFLFTDLESSTRLWERFPDAMKIAVERHDAILREAVEGASGRVVKTTGDGLMAVFPEPREAVAAALDLQRALEAEQWGDTGPLRVRVGINAGMAQERENDYFGPSVIRAARVMAVAHGGQVLLSMAAAEPAREALPEQAALRDLGEHRLKDLLEPERIFQLVHPQLSAEFPPLATLSVRPNNLPTQTSEFVGRDGELATVRDLLDAERIRLLTLTGPGGIGKTRLALQAAAEQIDRYDDGVYFVDLSAVRSPDEAFESVARTLDPAAARAEQPLEGVKAALHGRRLLLVLDNFEQVIGAAAGLVELLEHCSRLNVVVTSREALRVRGEHLFPVPPLELPGPDTPLERVAECEAVRLFVYRAQSAEPSFMITDENAGEVSEICARLDGLPLAIELAAARLSLFSTSDLVARLRSRLELLSSGPRDLPERQQTLRRTIEWSYELLDDEERSVFALLSLFFPARVETVEGVAGRLDPLGGVDVVGRLASLVDKSLVRSMEGRLWLLETIREYASDRLADERDAAARAHAEYFAELADDARTGLAGPDREQTLDRLGLEIGNLTRAWRYWAEAGDLGRLVQMVDALWAHHDGRGWYQAAVALMDDLLRVLGSVPSTPERARKEITLQMSLARGLLAIRGYTAEVEAAYSRALELCQQVGEVPRQAPVLRSLASFTLYKGEFDRTVELGRQILELAEQEQDVGLQIEGHVVTGPPTAFLGDVPGGIEHLERAIALFDPVRNPPARLRLGPSPGVVAQTTAAHLLWLSGFPERAQERALGSEELSRRLNHPYSLAYALYHVGLLHLWRREPDTALGRAVELVEVAREHEFEVWKALGLVLQGAATAALGRADEGVDLVERGLEIYGGLHAPPVFWPLLLSLRGATLGLAGAPAEGVALVDEGIALTGVETPLFPDVGVLRANLLLAAGDREAAVAGFRQALEVGERYGARIAQLRAALALCRLGESSAEADLRRVYDEFGEGQDLPDLVDARAVLGESVTASAG
jgi:predicted ATPase/class 3 adenylate cyclase